MKKTLRFLITVIFLAGFSLICVSRVSAANDRDLFYVYVTNDGTEYPVYPQNGSLYFPACVNPERITLHGQPGTVIYVEEEGTSVTMDEQGTAKDVDLTTLLGEIVPGQVYELRGRYAAGGSFSVKVSFTETASSLFVESEKPLFFLHQDRDNTTTGSMAIVSPTGEEVAAGDLSSFSCRGNSTFDSSMDKKPYNLKLAEAAELIPGAGAARKWVLLSHNTSSMVWYDRTGYYNLMALSMFSELGGSSALQCEPVELYVNGECRGLYVLTEKAETKTSRVEITTAKNILTDTENVTRVLSTAGLSRNIDFLNGQYQYTVPDTVKLDPDADDILAAGIQAYQYSPGTVEIPDYEYGFFIEVDYNQRNPDPCWFVTRQGVPVIIRDPEHASREQLKKIALYIQSFEDAVCSPTGFNADGKYYTEFMNVDSWTKCLLVNLFSVNTDFFYSSTYFYADAAETGGFTPMEFGPAWDFDYVRTVYRGLTHYRLGLVGFRCDEQWLDGLFSRGDFLYALDAENTTYFDPIVERYFGEGGIFYSLRDALEPEQLRNHAIWFNEYATRIFRVNEFFTTRYTEWMEKLWSDTVLKGAIVQREGDRLTVQVQGTADSYQWYRIDENRPDTCIPIEGANDPSYSPEQAGIYGVTVTGPNFAKNDYAVLNSHFYIEDNGERTLQCRETVSLNSNPVRFD